MTGRGALHRVLRIAGHHGCVRATLEDDFHHFRVVLQHADGIVTRIEAESPRFPYSLCPAAGFELRALEGMPLSPDMTAAFARTDARQHCTHQLDLAALAIAAAARGTVARRYDVAVADTEAGVDRHALLSRDGVPLLDWTIADYAVTSPADMAGRSLGSGFTAWVSESLDSEAAEAALVLRRGIFISGGRGMAAKLDAATSAPVSYGCWVQQPERAPLATRQRGSTLDFADRPERLTAGDDAWLLSAC